MRCELAKVDACKGAAKSKQSSSSFSSRGEMKTSLLLLALVLMPLSPVAAQPGSPLIIDRARQDRTQQAPPPAPPLVVQPAPSDRLSKVTPFALAGVRIQGTSMAPAALGAATHAFVGKRTDAAAIQAIAQAVSNAYAQEGDIAFYTVTVPEQDFAGGLLTLIVTEGHIEHVDVHGDVSGDVSRVVDMASRLTQEKPLRRSTLQHYLSLIRDLPGLTVDAQLLKGNTGGGVRLSLGLTQKKYALALTINNGGNALLGRTQLQADFSLYNLLREGEETKLSFGTSTLLDRYQYYAASHSEALDDDGTRASLGLGYLRTDVRAVGFSGDAETLQLAVSHPLIRSFEENLTVTGSVDGIDSTNALLGNLLANEDVRTVRLSGGYSISDANSLLTLNASASLGLDVLGAGLSTADDADFKKLVLSGQYNRLLDSEWVVRLRAFSQLAANRLPISELYALGGPDFGRAFLTATAQGDSALAGSVEVGFKPAWLDGWLAGLEVFGFGDDGSSWYRARPLTLAQDLHLASAGMGIRLPIGAKTRLEVQAANALDTNAPGTRTGAWRFLFGVTMQQ
jgi:hemolysin activation/secretion protein